MTGAMSQMIEFVAATQLGQFFIKRIDSLMWALERPAKYWVDGDSKDNYRVLPRLVFWAILISQQILRVVVSKILVQFDRNPIESKDIVQSLQKWRRTLRSIRFRGVRKMKECSGKDTDNGNRVTYSPPVKQPSKKRNHEEMLDHNLLEELMNRTFTDNDDDSDSTFMISCKDAKDSTNGSSIEQSHSEDNQSPEKAKYVAEHSDSLAEASESEHNEPNVSTKSNEITFVSTVDGTEESPFTMTEDDSISSLNEDGGMHQLESIGKLPFETASETEINGSAKSESNEQLIGMESLSQTVDPVDAMMSKLVDMDKNGKSNFEKKSDGRSFSSTKFRHGKHGKHSKSREAL